MYRRYNFAQPNQGVQKPQNPSGTKNHPQTQSPSPKGQSGERQNSNQPSPQGSQSAKGIQHQAPKTIQSGQSKVRQNHSGSQRESSQSSSQPHSEPTANQPPISQKNPKNYSSPDNNSTSITNLLLKFVPKGLYNRDTKKILGILSAEELLLIALIFLFLEDSGEDNSMLIIAILYVLLSDYIDLGLLPF